MSGAQSNFRLLTIKLHHISILDFHPRSWPSKCVVGWIDLLLSAERAVGIRLTSFEYYQGVMMKYETNFHWLFSLAQTVHRMDESPRVLRKRNPAA